MRPGLPPMHFRRIALPAIAFAFICSFTLLSYADGVNLLANGSFEQPLIPNGSSCGAYEHCLGFHNGVAGNDNIAGWQLIGKGGVDGDGNPLPGAPATIMVLGFNYAEPDNASSLVLNFHPQDGLQSVDLTGEGNQGITNGIKQSVTTTPGLLYDLSFWLGHEYSSAPGYTGGPASAALYIDGVFVGSYSDSTDIFEDVAWAPYSYKFTASSSSTVVAFLNNTPYGNNYSGLDNVSLRAVPEPSSFLLLGVTMSMLIGYINFNRVRLRDPAREPVRLDRGCHRRAR